MTEVIATKPNMASTPEENERLIQKALGRLMLMRLETWRTITPLEWFILEVANE